MTIDYAIAIDILICIIDAIIVAMARRLICALAALARAYDWTTPDAGLTPFNCTAFPNPIQVLLPDGQSAPYNVSELDLATGQKERSEEMLRVSKTPNAACQNR